MFLGLVMRLDSLRRRLMLHPPFGQSENFQMEPAPGYLSAPSSLEIGIPLRAPYLGSKFLFLRSLDLLVTRG